MTEASELYAGRIRARRLLKVGGNAGEEEITSAFRKLVKQNHPDIGGDPDKMRRLNNARRVLNIKLDEETQRLIDYYRKFYGDLINI
jgi:curved DNA-binding protein CbpA